MAYIDTSSVPTGMISPVLASPTSTQPPTPLMQNEAAGTTLLVTSQPIVASPVSSQISPQPSSTQSSKTQPSPQQSIQMSPGKISKYIFTLKRHNETNDFKMTTVGVQVVLFKNALKISISFHILWKRWRLDRYYCLQNLTGFEKATFSLALKKKIEMDVVGGPQRSSIWLTNYIDRTW